MRTPVYISIVSVALLAGCGNDNKPKPVATTNAPAAAAPASGGYLGGLVNAQTRAVKTVDTAALNQAVQLFQVQEGRLPKDLDELVKKQLIAHVPDAPVGMKIVYDAATGEVKVVNAQ
jgi:hypothetical protein